MNGFIKKLGMLGLTALALGVLIFGTGQPAMAGHPDGPVSYWSFDNDTAVDDGGHGYDGTLQDGASFSGTVPPTPGNVKSVVLDGSGDFVLVADPASGDLDFTGPFAIAAWINLPDLSGVHEVVSKLDNTPSANSAAYELVVVGSELRGTVYDDSKCGPGGGCQTYISRRALGALSTGWQHVAMVYDGGSTNSAIKLYVDGVQVDDTDLTGGIFVSIEDVTADVMIGANTKANGNIGNFFHGLIDEVQIYERALSADEVAYLAGTTDQLFVDEDGQVGFGNSIDCDGVGIGAYTTIQDAVDDASDDDTIKVCPGTYDEQVEVRDIDNLSLEGKDATITVPQAGMTGSLVKIVDSNDFHISGFTVDGINGVGVSYGSRNSGGDTDTRFYGIFVVNSSGHIAANTIRDVSWGNGVQQGLGIYVYVDDAVMREVNIRDNTITNFQKNGITVYGPVEAKIHKNTVTGWGDTNVIAQNCIQLGGDPNMTASVTRNDISRSMYTPLTWASTGILAVWGNDNIRIVNNTISDTMIGIYVYPGSTSAKITNNSGSGNMWDYYTYEDDTKIHANKFE